jgi:hypothetical protein
LTGTIHEGQQAGVGMVAAKGNDSGYPGFQIREHNIIPFITGKCGVANSDIQNTPNGIPRITAGSIIR